MSERPDLLRNRVFCSMCGVQAGRRHGRVPLGWQELPDGLGRGRDLCPHCVRQSLWLIEARLDVDREGGLDA